MLIVSGLAVATASRLTPTVTFAIADAPKKSVTVTLYVVVTSGDASGFGPLVVDSVGSASQVKLYGGVPPLTFTESVADWPTSIVDGSACAVAERPTLTITDA